MARLPLGSPQPAKHDPLHAADGECHEAEDQVDQAHLHDRRAAENEEVREERGLEGRLTVRGRVEAARSADVIARSHSQHLDRHSRHTHE